MIEKNVDSFISSIVYTHKFELSHRQAFFLHKTMVNQLKKCKFSLPPKRLLSTTCETSSYIDDCKSTQGTISSENNCGSNLDNNEVLRAATETQSTTLNKILSILTQYEDFLRVHNLVQEESLKSIVQFNRSLLVHILEQKLEYSSIPRDSLALTILLLSAEKTNINKTVFLKFITETLQNKRISKISQLRRGKSYLLLARQVYPNATRASL